MKMQLFFENRTRFIFIGLLVFSFFLLDTHLANADCGTCPYTCVLGFGDVWSGSSDNYTSPGGLSSWKCNDSNGSFIVPNACVHAYTPGFCGAPAAVACVGSWSNNATCSVTGACGQTGVRQQTYTITTPASGGGAACPFANGATRWGSTACSTAPCLVVNGACAATHYTCGAGTSINNANNATTWTWSCQGSGGGSTASCSENKLLGTVNVSSNVSSSWTITGPASISGSGTTQSSPSQPTGAYTITWDAVAGYVTPAPQNLSLTPGGTISFSGTYTAIVLTPTANLSAVPISVPYNTSSTLNWSSTNATSCTAGGAWSGSKPTTSFGMGTSATFASVGDFPQALAFDTSGNLYTANGGGSRNVSKITPAGVVSNFSTIGTFPYALAFDAAGNLYTANGLDSTVSKITPAGARSTFATLPGGSFPMALAFDAAGNLYTANVSNNRVSKITPAGVVSTFATIIGGSYPSALAFDTAGNLYTANGSSDNVSRITPAGIVSTFATVGSFPSALAFDTAGNLYTANANGDTVSRITPARVVSTFATVGDSPRALAFDAAGNLYTANAYDNTVSRITPARVVSTFATVGNSPRALSFDAAGNLYTANANDNTVSKITPAGGFNTGNLTSSQTYTLYCSGGGEDSSIQTVVVNVIVPSTLKMCPTSCTSGGTPYDTLPSFPADAPVTLYACYGTGNCSLGDLPINGTWTETNVPDNAISLSTGLGLSVDVTQSNLGNASEQLHLSYPSGVPVPTQVTATAAVSCAALTCSSPSIVSQRASYCPSVSNTFDDNCGGMTAACDGMRNCDFNWKEIAP